jgi:signal transduction histidine kinase/CheY-like chemotaxis protein
LLGLLSLTHYSYASAHNVCGSLSTNDAHQLFSYFIDNNGNRSLNDIKTLPDSAFAPQKDHILPVFHKPLWYKFTLYNTDNTPLFCYLDLGDFLYNKATLYSIRDGELFIQETGLDIKSPERYVYDPTFVFTISLEPNETKTLYLNVVSDFNPHFNPYISELSGIYAAHYYKSALANGITGVLMGGMLYLMLISLTLKNRSLSIYFIAFLLSSIAVQFTMHHNLHAHMQSHPKIFPILYTILQCINGLLFILFCKKFFPFKKNLPRLDQLLSLTGFIYFFIILLALSNGTRYTHFAISFTTHFLIFYLIVASIYFWRKGQPYALHFLVALCSFALLKFVDHLNDIHVLPHLFFTSFSYGLSNCIIVFIFALILAQQVNQAKEEQLKTAKNALKVQAQSQAKSDFLAKMSHEIRTPMNGVIGMIQLLKETPLNETQSAYIDVVEQSGNTLMTVINDILDYSKVEAGKLTLESTSFNIDHLLDSACSLFIEQSQQQHTELISQVDPNIPKLLCGDPTRLSQILNNLISNALKFTKDGEVFIEVKKLYSTPNGKHNIRFSITDTGIGIDSKKVNHLFQAFEQADSSTTRLYGGTGLGLAICAQLVNLMHGKIGVTSQVGKGSTFWFDLPLEEDGNNHLSVIPDNNETLSKQRLLICDSSNNYAQSLLMQTKEWKLESMLLDSRISIIDTLKNAIEKQNPYTLLLIDHASHPDALKVAEQIANEAEFNKLHCFITYTNSDVIPSTPKTHIIKKPINTAQWHDIFVACLTNQPTLLPLPIPKRDFSNLSILVAEDNEVNRKVIGGMLKQLQAHYTFAENGLEALNLTKHHHANFDIILMDCEMPIMDGYSTSANIRQFEADNSLKRIPIIALTAHALDELRDKSLAHGMDAHLAKPLKLNVLESTLRLWAPQESLSNINPTT